MKRLIGFAALAALRLQDCVKDPQGHQSFGKPVKETAELYEKSETWQADTQLIRLRGEFVFPRTACVVRY